MAPGDMRHMVQNDVEAAAVPPDGFERKRAGRRGCFRVTADAGCFRVGVAGGGYSPGRCTTAGDKEVELRWRGVASPKASRLVSEVFWGMFCLVKMGRGLGGLI